MSHTTSSRPVSSATCCVFFSAFFSSSFVATFGKYVTADQMAEVDRLAVDLEAVPAILQNRVPGPGPRRDLVDGHNPVDGVLGELVRRF